MERKLTFEFLEILNKLPLPTYSGKQLLEVAENLAKAAGQAFDIAPLGTLIGSEKTMDPKTF